MHNTYEINLGRKLFRFRRVCISISPQIGINTRRNHSQQSGSLCVIRRSPSDMVGHKQKNADKPIVAIDLSALSFSRPVQKSIKPLLELLQVQPQQPELLLPQPEQQLRPQPWQPQWQPSFLLLSER